VPHACRCGRGSRLAPGHERRATHCVCVCVRHTAQRTLWGVQLVRQGLGAGGGREGARTRRDVGGGGPPHVQRRVRAFAGLDGGAPWSQRDASSQRNRKFADGGLPADKKSSNWSSRAKPDGRPGEEPGDVRLGWGPRVRREARLPHASRAWSKREKGDRPKGTDSRGGAPDARPKTHALQNDTPRPEPAPAGMLQGLPIAAERRAVGWGDSLEGRF
jgi:hypothetical protein